MGLVINPRGTSGAGKTELVRRILAEYGNRGRVEPIQRPGRLRPIAWRADHPLGDRPLAVIGHYERTRGGCDTIPLRDGGLDEAFRLADSLAREGHDVLMEGLHLSGEHRRSAALAVRHHLHVLRLEAPVETCVRNVLTRRRAGGAARESIERTAFAAHQAMDAACHALAANGVVVEHLDFEAALRRMRELLRMPEPDTYPSFGPLGLPSQLSVIQRNAASQA